MQDVPCQPRPAWLIQKLDELAFKTRAIHLCRHIVEGLPKQSQIEEKNQYSDYRRPENSLIRLIYGNSGMT